MESCNLNPEGCKLYAAQLDWDKMTEEGFYQKLEYTNKEKLVEGKFSDLQFDMVIGSDVVYWPQSIEPLCTVLDTLFTKQKPGLVFYICYIERIKSVHRNLLSSLQNRNFSVLEIAKNVTKPIYEHAYIYKVTRPKVISINLM